MADDFSPKDTVLKSPDGQRALLQAISRCCHGHSRTEVVGACFNLIVAAIRQSIALRPDAEREWDMLAGQTKQLLLDHYDAVSGQRKVLFPYHQQVFAPLHIDEDVIFKLDGRQKPSSY